MRDSALRRLAALGAVVLLVGACGPARRGRVANGGSPSPGVTSPGSMFVPVPNRSALRWRPLAPAPTARQEVAAAVVGGKIHVAGGLLDDGRATDVVEVYDPATDLWSAAPRLPVPLHHAMAVGWRDRLVVLGGFTGSLGGPASSKVFLLEGGRWTELPELQNPRGAGAAAVVGSLVVVAGGLGPAGHVAPVEVFSGMGGWRERAPIPSLRDHLAGATDGRLLFAAGGRRAGGQLSAFEAYDPAGDVWSRLPDLPTARSGLGAAVADGLVITVGGEGPRMFPEVEAYVIADRAWSRLPDLGVPRHGVGVVAIGSAVYAAVGGTRVGLGASTVLEVLSAG